MSPTQLESTWLARLGLAQLGSAQLRSARLGVARPGSTRLAWPGLGSAWLLGSARFSRFGLDLAQAWLGSPGAGLAELNWDWGSVWQCYFPHWRTLDKDRLSWTGAEKTQD